MAVTLLRKSKQNYYAALFIENQSNMINTWDCILYFIIIIITVIDTLHGYNPSPNR